MNFFDQRLAQRGQTFSIGGKIRVGTKEIIKKARENPIALGIYQRVLRGELSFREAEKQIEAQAGIRTPFYPRNTREFHPNPWDMGTGGAATTERLLSLYGEIMEGDKAAKLYRFPIVFPEVGNDISSIVDGGLSVQGGGANTVRYWSAFDESGIQVCKHLPEVKKSQQAQRSAKPIRHPERVAITRGPCVPANCSEYGSGMCRFNGRIRFYIPGLPGAGVFELHTGSTDAATDVYLRLTTALRAMGNVIRNYTPNGQPVFWLRKVKKQRAYYDESGDRKIGEQWVPELDMAIEMPKVIMISESKAKRIEFDNQTGRPFAPAPAAWLQDETAGKADLPDGGQSDTADRPTDGGSTGTALDAASQQQGPGAAQSSAQGSGSAGVQPPSLSNLEAMKVNAFEGDYNKTLSTWVLRRHQGDDAKAAEAWAIVARRFGPRVKDWLELSNYIDEMNVSSELVTAYFKAKFGGYGHGERLGEMLSHLKELFSDGVSVGVSVMEEMVPDAVAQNRAGATTN